MIGTEKRTWCHWRALTTTRDRQSLFGRKALRRAVPEWTRELVGEFNFPGSILLPNTAGFREHTLNAVVQLLDTGHFATETHVEEIAVAMRKFLAMTAA